MAASGCFFVLRIVQNEHVKVQKARSEVSKIIAEQKAVMESRLTIEKANAHAEDINKLYVQSEKVALFLDEIQVSAQRIIPGFEFTAISVTQDKKSLVMLGVAQSSNFSELLRLQRAFESLPYKITVNSVHFYTSTNPSDSDANIWKADFEMTLESYVSP